MSDDNQYSYGMVTVKHVTDNAILVDSEWIPKSQIEEPVAEEIKKGDDIDLYVTSWFAKRKGWM